MNSDESEIDDEKFFLAKNGKVNAKDELEATLYALYNEKSFEDNSTACKFPARKLWLQNTLHLEGLAEVECKQFNKLMKKLDPNSVTLIFPNAHINSPASMFGHTFLRIDSSYNSKLLSYAVNYSANAILSNENGALYALKGIFGGYEGVYSLLAYTDKLKEYRDTDRRDIWEYQLNLTEDETRKMMYHIWELNQVYSWYYFFSENCSYNMLWLLEVARPSISLRDKFTYFVTPPATIQVIYEENLIKSQTYRPSKRTTLLAYEDILGSKNITLSDDLALDKISLDDILKDKTLDIEEQQYILEGSALLLEYYFLNGVMKNELYTKRLYDILSARSKLGVGKELVVKQQNNPDYAHKTSRILVREGYRNDDFKTFLGIRPSYHSLDDFNLGFLEGTQIEFFDTLFSYIYKNNKHSIELEKATILSISSFSQVSTLFKPISYALSAGWNQDSLIDNAQFSADASYGMSMGNEYTYIYGLIQNSMYIGGEFMSNISIAIGPKIGIISYNKYLQTNIDVRWRYYDSLESQFIGHFSESFRVEKNHIFSLEYDFIQKQKRDQTTFSLTYKYFF